MPTLLEIRRNEYSQLDRFDVIRSQRIFWFRTEDVVLIDARKRMNALIAKRALLYSAKFCVTLVR